MKQFWLIWLLASAALGAPRINEFLPSNDEGIRDSFGKRSDWIEIYNDGEEAVNLLGYGLTDSEQKPFKWTFPETNLAARAYLLVFASDNNERTPGKELHCDFKLSASGEYLALTKPDGTKLSEFAPFPAMPADLSYGLGSTAGTKLVKFLPERANCYFFVPSNNAIDDSWFLPEFDASYWEHGPGGVGYERDPGKDGVDFRTYIGQDVEAYMYDKSTACYMRFPFVIKKLKSYRKIVLSLLYDDSVLVYLNGVRILKDPLFVEDGYESHASEYREETQTVLWSDFGITEFQDLLHEGTNILAIAGVNNSKTSTDFLVYPKLWAEEIQPGEDTFFGYLAKPTPGMANTEAFSEILKTPKPNVEPGFFTKAFLLSLSCETEGAKIYYTLDGTTPREGNSQLYTAPISVNSTTILRARAFKENTVGGGEFTGTFVFLESILQQKKGVLPGPRWPNGSVNGQVFNYGLSSKILESATYKPQLEKALKDLPFLSIVTSPANLFNTTSGIYVHASSDGSNWERQAHLELLNHDKSKGFSIGCGLRIRGGFSRSSGNPKHSFRFFFRPEWGASKLNFPLFEKEGVTSFKRLDLRTAQNYSWHFADNPYEAIYCRDVFARDLQLSMGEPCTRSRYYHVLLNGHYWGLYQTEERPEEHFAESYFGGDQEDYDVLKPDGYYVQVKSGNNEAWRQLWQMTTNGFSQVSYNRATGRSAEGYPSNLIPVLLDPTNVADVTIVNNIVSNHDSPLTTGQNMVNNFFAIYNRKNPAGFKFFCHDNEHALVEGYVNSDLTRPNDTGSRFVFFNSNYLHQKLMACEAYKQVFISRVCKHYFNNGVCTKDKLQNLFQKRANSIRDAVIMESARWGDIRQSYSSVLPFERDRDWLPEIDFITEVFLPARRQITLFYFRGRGWFPDLDPPIFSQPGGIVAKGTTVSLSGSEKIVYTLDGSDPWTSSTAQVYTSPITIQGSCLVRCCYAKDAVAYNMPAEAAFCIPKPSPLVITEILLNPNSPTRREISGEYDAAFFKRENYGFIELYNNSPEVFYPYGQFVTGSLNYVCHDFSPSMDPYEYAVVAANPAVFRRRYGKDIKIIGAYSKLQDTSVLNLSLTNYHLTVNQDWFPREVGRSLVVRDENLPLRDYSSKTAWQLSLESNGSPGAPDLPEATPLFFLLLFFIRFKHDKNS